jgi:hypothetical protein
LKSPGIKEHSPKPDVVVHACIPALGRMSQEDNEFEITLDYKGRFCLKIKKKQKKRESIYPPAE